MHPVFEQVKKINAGGVIRSVARNTVFHTSGKWYGSRQCDTSGNTKSKVTFPVPNPKMKGYLSGADDWKVRYDEDEKQNSTHSTQAGSLGTRILDNFFHSTLSAMREDSSLTFSVPVSRSSVST